MMAIVVLSLSCSIDYRAYITSSKLTEKPRITMLSAHTYAHLQFMDEVQSTVIEEERAVTSRLYLANSSIVVQNEIVYL